MAQALDPATLEPTAGAQRWWAASRTGPARTALRNGDRRRADLRRAGDDAARVAVGDARRHTRRDPRPSRSTPGICASRRTASESSSPRSIASCARSTCSSGPARNRRRRGCRSRPMATRAASGRRMACASRGRASAARSCSAAPARCCRSKRSRRSTHRCRCGTGRAMGVRC